MPPIQESQHGQHEHATIRPLHPFDLTEILHAIGLCLDKNTLMTCLLVSRSWNATFLSLVWSEVKLSLIGSNSKLCPIEIVNKHSAFVRTLYISGQDRLDYPYGSDLICPNLSVLHLQDYSDRSNTSNTSFIRHHQATITSLSFDRHAPPELLEVIIACPRLRALSFQYCMTHPQEWISLYESLGSRVHILTLRKLWSCPLEEQVLLKGLPLMPTDEQTALIVQRVGPSRIQDLTIKGARTPGAVLRAQVWFMARCQDLRRLRQEVDECPFNLELERPHPCMMELLSEAIRSDPWSFQKLETLALPGVQFHPESFSRLMERVAALTELDLQGTNLNMEFWWILHRNQSHLNSLKVVNLLCCSWLPGAAIQELLCSMRRLEVFSVGTIEDTDFVDDPRPWACQESLRELVLGIKVTSQESGPMILQRLSTMTRLERCLLVQSVQSRDQFIRLKLEDSDGWGLDQLRDLRRLKAFRLFPGCSWGSAEAHWVLENWPRLERLWGFQLKKEAKELLRRVNAQ